MGHRPDTKQTTPDFVHEERHGHGFALNSNSELNLILWVSFMQRV